jgi:hypothetical protein
VYRYRRQIDKKLRRYWKRRSAIEPTIGHVKTDCGGNGHYTGSELRAVLLVPGDLNDLWACMKYGWWETEKLKWKHRDFKDVSLLYTQELFKELTTRGVLK